MVCEQLSRLKLPIVIRSRSIVNFNRLKPMIGEVASSAEAMKAADMPVIAARAQAGFSAWSAMGPNARRAVLMNAAAALEAKAVLD
jgi:benzaldehyde dehydrogenase (NAD)